MCLVARGDSMVVKGDEGRMETCKVNQVTGVMNNIRVGVIQKPGSWLPRGCLLVTMVTSTGGSDMTE